MFADTILLVGNDVVHIHIDAGDFQAGGEFNFVFDAVGNALGDGRNVQEMCIRDSHRGVNA